MTFMASTLERPLKIKGQIVRTLPDGIGVQFLKESQIQEDMIRALLDHLFNEEAHKIHYWRPFGVDQGALDS